MSKKIFAGLENITGTLSATDEVVVNDVSVGHTDKVYANSLSSLRKVTNKTQASSVTLTVAEAGIITVANTSTMTLVLPAAASSTGLEFTFIKTTSDAQVITIDGNASETINGATTFTSLDAQYDSVTIVCNGSAWYITAKNIA